MRQSEKPRMIGVFTAELDDAYQTAVLRGIETRARDFGIGVISFVGHRIDSPIGSEAIANVVYRLANKKNVDGLIVVSTTIATFLDAEDLAAFISARNKMPQISVGLKVPGIGSITVDGSEAVAGMVRHLVRDHGRTRFALIGGPPGHSEADERQNAFLAALEEEGIPFDEKLAANGDFIRRSGADAARTLLLRGVAFDALFCMNDRMAFGALDTLQERGLRVPEDVSVIGFDGIEESRYVSPPLTTVLQPLNELGASAVEMLVGVLNGGKPRDRVLTSVPIIRQSCGCPPRRLYNSGLTELPSSATAEEREIIDELTALAVQPDSEGFIALLNDALSAASRTGRKLRVWNDYLSLVRHRRDLHPAARRDDGTLFEAARVLIGETEGRLHAARWVDSEDRLSTALSVSNSLAGAFEMPDMLRRLETGLKELGIGEGFLALFDGGEPVGARSRLVMAPRKRMHRCLGEKGLRFRTLQLLPPCVDASWRKSSWVLEALVFQDEPLGYMLLPRGAADPAVYGTLSDQVAGALKGALLLEQERTHERRLEEEVARRTAELTRTNRELACEIARRMHLEQEVLEISNLTMQRIGQDLHDDLCQHLAGVAMHFSVLRDGIAHSAPSSAALIDRIGDLLSDSIARAKQIARGLYPAGLAEHGLASTIEDLVEMARRSYPVTIDFRASPDFRIGNADRALQVYRIIQEALANALKHSGSDRIDVRLGVQQRTSPEGKKGGTFLVSEVIDYGVGIANPIPDEGMGLRIMRCRAASVGAELTIDRLKQGTRVACRLALGKRS
ncbi:MAG: substrate-binding domain-containing protein [Spirochaetaceae bacterium]|nr:MAG: substrate-binding domain-containing protein [Spirochaetaceae bacterium]